MNARRPPDWSFTVNSFQPLTRRDDPPDWRTDCPGHARRSVPPFGLAYHLRRAKRRWYMRGYAITRRLHARVHAPGNRDDRDGWYFAAGELYVIGVLGTVWALIHYL